jgi:general stress protein YciG
MLYDYKCFQQQTPREQKAMDEEKRLAGRKGGLATYEKYGKEHMAEIGKRGAKVTWSRYTLLPYRQSQWAMVNRETGHVKAIICDKDKEA